MTVLIGLIILVIDQVSKYLVTKSLLQGESIPIINGIFHITLVENTGGAFGIFKSHTLFFIITSITAVIIIFFLSLRLHKAELTTKMGMGLILGGALGNLIDRLKLGWVIDFLDFRIWPVFNIADASITIGTGLLLFNLLLFKHKKRAN